MSVPVYMDTNATAPLAEEVRRAMEPWLAPVPANGSSIHAAGRAARLAIEQARDRVAGLLGPGTRVVFTSGGTEADNQALWGSAGWPPRGHLLVSALEHPAVSEPAQALAALGVEVTTVPVDGDGRVDPEAIAEALRPDTALVSVMTANNEIGTVQPIARIAEIAHGAGVAVHTDAVQAVAWLDLPEAVGSADLVSISGHKIGGPPGIGALALRNDADLEPLVRGGGQQSGRRGGTEPTALIVGLGAACERVARRRAEESRRVAALGARLRAGIRESIADVHETAAGATRLPNTVHLCFPGCRGDALVARLDLEGLAASAGSACASGVAHGSPVLAALGLSAPLAASALRLSLGYHSTVQDVDAAVRILAEAVAGIRAAGLPAVSGG